MLFRSFNNPAGACPDCNGLGEIEFVDPSRVVEFPDLSLASGAIRGWDRRNEFAFATIESLAQALGFDLDQPFASLPEDIRDIILFGSGRRKLAMRYGADAGRAAAAQQSFEGVIPNLERRRRDTESSQVREELGRYLSKRP